MRKIVRSLAWLAAFNCAGGSILSAAGDTLEVTVVGQVASSYKRQKLPDGTTKPETYAIANGGKIPGTTGDASTEKVPFPTIAAVVARQLAKQKYVLAETTRTADLLIVVQWGSTLGYEGANLSRSIENTAAAASTMNSTSTTLQAMKNGTLSSTPEQVANLERERQLASDEMESAVTMAGLENRSRDMANLDNAKILGYLDAINARRDVLFSEISGTAHDLMRDVEEKRYFVIVSAYDFRGLQEKNKPALRWVTRISIRSTGNRFDDRMAQMLAAASNALGKKSDLNRRFYGDPRVELGEVEYLGIAAPVTPGGAAPGDQATREKPGK